MDSKIKKYIISLIFTRISNAIKVKSTFRAKIIDVKGLGKFIIGDLKVEKRKRKKFSHYNKKYNKKVKTKARNKIPDKIDNLL